ncbi:MAG: 50S ribosomal protein L25/general stress protein Ctc [Gammaproteobacteria bacterium]|nr:50S ribosomal protein L25/general stress protein Ctc [Gammaproteobacteria bacterium]NIR84629.1 50S ribosomal protein L25/general stress protein Ctc [Gammaproteobacteria bacterium]NIR90532.1 50S ribosomal protein L25/general stress protein Ctc [Gammaproteobacteria bacterium]NIU05680.1 50S ribosomal protein L25/general stress protein Ctc [Gammaproteobacteria bacterium]NIV52819.1 50S ribosomal protein L25/general stress protein Ctc [Gammaproteobacteria bacterium]
MEFELVAEQRDTGGSGAARRLRREGKVPAVLYGAGKDVIHLTLNANDLKRKLAHQAFLSHILTVKIGRKKEQAILKDLQRLPGTPRVLHVDLQRVVATQALEMRVPIHFLNEEECAGKRAGGVISHLMTDVAIRCLPKDLPEYLEIDVSDVEVGGTLHLSQLKVPEGVELVGFDPEDEESDQGVVTVYQAREFVEEEEVPEEEIEEGAEAAAEGAKPEEGEEVEGGEEKE